MNNSDFEGPPFGWALLSIVGGLVTAIALIIGVELSADRIRAHFYSPSETTPSASSSTAKN